MRLKHQKHGYSKHKLYMVRCNILSRCFNKKSSPYLNYGGRGISVHKEWVINPKAFFEWCLSNGWKEGLSIDRIDNNGDYAPDNCRFVTLTENNRNKRKYKNNKSGYRGVSFNKKDKKWVAQITINNMQLAVGRCFSPIDAAVIRDSFVINKGLGLPLNFPQPIRSILPNINP